MSAGRNIGWRPARPLAPGAGSAYVWRKKY